MKKTYNFSKTVKAFKSKRHAKKSQHNESVTMILQYEAVDCHTRERLLPGDTAKITFRAFFGGYDDEGNKKFYNKYELVRRTSPLRKAVRSRRSGR